MKMSVPKRFYYGIGNLMNHKYIHRLMPAKYYIKVRWYQTMGYELDLKNPKTFNEKLQWLKLYDRNPLYPLLVDKYEVKKWISEKIGAEYVIPTLAVYNSADEIDIDSLPNEFVLKCTHDSGSTIICNNKASFNVSVERKKLQASLRYNYFWNAREWPYAKIKHRIVAEKYINDSSIQNKNGIVDYKFFCFNGYVDCVMVCIDRATKETKYFFMDKEWNILPYNIRGMNESATAKIPKPKCLIEMFSIASSLSQGFPFVRVDMYSINDHPLFGEMTFFPNGGFDPNIIRDVDFMFGDKIQLS